MVSFTPLAPGLDHTFIPVINMVCITPNSMTTKDQASSGSQILGFYKARTQWSRIV